jgi:predicted nucleic acid-binding protein
MRTPRALLDASVLYPVSLRNLLMRLLLARLFQGRWSVRIHDEWIRAVLRDNPTIPAIRLQELRDAMDRRAGDDVVVTGYESLIDGLALPDPDDRHVLAAAITGQADMIVTRNLKDFPAAALAQYNLEAMHPDDFLQLLLELSPMDIVEVVHDQQASLKNPPVPMADLLSHFERLDLKATAARLRRLMG